MKNEKMKSVIVLTVIGFICSSLLYLVITLTGGVS